MKGMHSLILTAFLIMIVIAILIPAVSVTLPFIGESEEYEITVKKDVYTMGNALDAAKVLTDKGFSTEVIDLRTVAPLAREALINSVAKTGRLLVVDEDYREFGLSGELAAIALEAGLPIKFKRVCTLQTIPYARHLEDQVLPNTQRIIEAALDLMNL